MARIIYPDDFVSQQLLFIAIKTKHEADGTDSPVIPYLAQQGIDLAAGGIALADAALHETTRVLLRNQSENYRELRDHLFNPVFARFQKQVQFLKSFYKGNPGELGNWGVTVTGEGRMAYPPSFVGRMQLFIVFVQKHLSFAAGASPLQPFLTQQQVNLTADQATAYQAMDHHTSFTQAAVGAENEKQQRDAIWLPVRAWTRSIGDFMKKMFAGNEKRLGLWGFTVDDSPQMPKLRTSIIKAASQMETNGVVNGSAFTNLGTVPLHVYKGKSTVGTPSIVSAGEQLGMTKGSSIITVVNPSTTTDGKFSVLTRK